jgi:nitrogen fixation NifU-like protein
MMSELGDLYQEIIIDHSKRPRNFGPVAGATARAEGFNPLCGDKVAVQLKIENDVVTEAGFQGSGCAISTASASLMTESLKGKTRDQVERLFERFHDLLTGEATPEDLGKLQVFSGVREYPVRVKCATLAWHTLRAALRESGAETPRVSTE